MAVVGAVGTGYTVGTTVYNAIGSIFGGGEKTIWEKYNMSQVEFDGRLSTSSIAGFQAGAQFRNLWRNGYFANEGATEIPAGLTVEDFHEALFGIRVGAGNRHLYPYGLGSGTVAIPNVTTLASDVMTSTKDAVSQVSMASVGIIGALVLVGFLFVRK